MSCWSGYSVVDLAVSLFGLTAVDLVVVAAVVWLGCGVVDLEEVSVSSVSPVSVVVGFVFASTLTAVWMLLCLHRS